MRQGEGRGILYIKALGGPVKKIYAPGGPSLSLKGRILFLEIVYFYFGGMNKKQDGRGGGARSARFGVAMSSKRQVRAAHGRALAAKTH